MKTLLKSLPINILIIISLSTSTFANNIIKKNKEPRAILLDGNIRRILVTGNVDLLIVQNKKEGIVYDEANEGKAIVVKDGDMIKINSAGTQTTKLILYVNNFYRIEASGNATVKNYGTFNLKYLQLFLKDNATATINSNTIGLFTLLNDYSSLKLNGLTNNHILTTAKGAKLIFDNFYAIITQNNPDEFLAESK